jgi:hypothetical protein
MHSKWKTISLAAALAVAGCGGGDGGGDASPASTDPDAWMDDARVEVRRDEASGRETVTLVDPASGHSEVMSDEPLLPGAVEVDDLAAVVAALATGLSD